MSDTLETLAGTLPDGQVAERLGLKPAVVKAWRREHGIEPCRRGPAARRREAPRRQTRGSAKARLDTFRAQMGKVSDDQIAAQAGVGRGVVGAYRRKHGIAAYDGYLFEKGSPPPKAKAYAPEPRVGRPSRIDDYVDLIGVEPDAVVAEKAGVSRSAVTAWRARNGVTASQPRSKTPKTQKAREADPVSLYAYTVTAARDGVQQEFVAVGSDIEAACRSARVGLDARDDGPWTIEAIAVKGVALRS